MGTELPKLKPVKFPPSQGKGRPVIYKIESSKGKPTKEIIAEMKRLSKKDIYPTDQ